MAWNKISAYATSIPDMLLVFTSKWRDLLLSRWCWIVLLIIIVSMPVMGFLHRRYYQEIPIEETTWQDFIPPIKNAEDSPFFAYLGHNILTTGCPVDPDNTSMDAIGRIPEHMRFEEAILAGLSEEPPEYNDDINDVLPPLPHCRSYTYPDSQNMHMRYDHVEQMQDTAQDRRWQRRTMYICAI